LYSFSYNLLRSHKFQRPADCSRWRIYLDSIKPLLSSREIVLAGEITAQGFLKKKTISHPSGCDGRSARERKQARDFARNKLSRSPTRWISMERLRAARLSISRISRAVEAEPAISLTAERLARYRFITLAARFSSHESVHKLCGKSARASSNFRFIKADSHADAVHRSRDIYRCLLNRDRARAALRIRNPFELPRHGRTDASFACRGARRRVASLRDVSEL